MLASLNDAYMNNAVSDFEKGVDTLCGLLEASSVVALHKSDEPCVPNIVEVSKDQACMPNGNGGGSSLQTGARGLYYGE